MNTYWKERKGKMCVEVMQISSNAKYMFHGDEVIIFNRTNKQWLKMSKECYDILMIYNNSSIEEMMKNLADDEDREYMQKIVLALKDMKLLVNGDSVRRLHDVSFAISNRCNLKCKHCMVNAESCGENDHFSTEEILRAFDKIIAANPERITVTGGEPLVRNDFLQIITYLRKNFKGAIGLMTNAVLINEKNADVIISSVDNISISLDGVNDETVSLIRGEGVFDKVISAIELLHIKKFKNISLSMVITADNEIYINDFFALCKKHQCEPVVRALSLYGRAQKNKELLTKRQLDLKSQDTVVEKVEKKDHRFYTCSCDAGVTTLTIENDGSIYPCNLFVEPQYCLGNISEIEQLESILQTNPHTFVAECLKEFEPDMIPECKGCDVSYFCWSCLHEVLELRNNNAIQKKCDAVKAILSEVWE